MNYLNVIIAALTFFIVIYIGLFVVIPQQEIALKYWMQEHPNETPQYDEPGINFFGLLKLVGIIFVLSIILAIIANIIGIPDQIEYFERFPGFKE